MSSSEVLLASGPRSRSACYSRAAEVVARAGADGHTNLPGHSPGRHVTALDAVGARLFALRALLRGRTDP